MGVFFTWGARISRARASVRRATDAATSRWASSPTTSRCSTHRKRDSTASGAAPNARAARCAANARSRSTNSSSSGQSHAPLLPAQARHERVEVLPRSRDRLLRADHLEEVVLLLRARNERAEDHVAVLLRTA